MTVTAFLPAKGSSKRVPGKNMRLLNGEPLFVHTLRKLLANPDIDHVYLDSEDDEILEIGKRLGSNIIKRDPSLASNDTDGHELFACEVSQVPHADIYVQALCTAPFVTQDTVSEAIYLLRSTNGYDSVVAGSYQRNYTWEDNKPTYGHGRIPNSSELSCTAVEGMSLYVVKGSVAREKKRRIGYFPYFMPVKPLELIDVNTEDDLRLAELIAKGMLYNDVVRLEVLKTRLSSSLLADICEELHLGGVIDLPFTGNVPGRKLFGRARTLAIVKKDEPSRSVYEALDSYKTVAYNDVLVIQHKCEGLAYFGELNARLSIRAGAQGAIISGKTRDTAAVAGLNFPVFAVGQTCRDVKYAGMVGSINQPVYMGGELINPSDLIFADQDGVVVIPFEHEEQILKHALASLDKEDKIVADIAKYVETSDILHKHGEF